MRLQELFLEAFAKDAYQNALKERKKSITYDNLCKLVLTQLFWEPFHPFIVYPAWKIVDVEMKKPF